MSKHTPGKWVSVNGRKPAILTTANDGSILEIALIPKTLSISEEEKLANGLLISAAPELLEFALAYTDQETTVGELDDLAAVAVRKAIGR